MPPDTPEPRSDAEVRADDAARAGADAIENRAIGSGTVVRNRRVAPDRDVNRSETRAIYRDPDGNRRVVGPGQPIPDGWTKVESAVLSDRAERGPRESAAAAGDGDDEGNGKRRSRAKS